jgi:polyisoprenoid-binding protein YceI
LIQVPLARLGPAIALAGLAIVACGGAAGPSSAAATTPTATPAAVPSTSAGGSANAWTVTNATKATVRVREQLVGVSLPSDAVLTATGASGTFVLNADGTFSSDSKISIDLTTLASDQRDRDNFIKRDTLNTRQFPKAEFVPTDVSGLALPLPASGTFTFTLAGNMTIRGKTKQVSFDVTAKRDGANLTATATANPSWKFADFGMTAPSVPFRVVSVTDEIKLSVDLVATGPVA